MFQTAWMFYLLRYIAQTSYYFVDSVLMAPLKTNVTRITISNAVCAILFFRK